MEKMIEMKYRHINRSKSEITREALRALADDMIAYVAPKPQLDLTLAAIASRGRCER